MKDKLIDMLAEVHRVLTPVVEVFDDIVLGPVRRTLEGAIEKVIEVPEEPEDFDYLEKEI